MAVKISKHIKKLQLTTRRKVYSLFLGNYRSVFKGQGIDFEDLREYVPGDNIKDIDWNATARTGTLYVRKYLETKELKIIFAVDTSSSMGLNLTEKVSKTDLVIDFMLLISFAALQNNDRIGAALFNQEHLKTIQFGKGRSHMIRILDQTYLDLQQNYFRDTYFENILNYLLHNVKKRVITFFITDNIDLDDQRVEKLLKATNKKHELVFVHINELEPFLESVNIPLYVQDIETGKSELVRFNDKKYKTKILAHIKEQNKDLKKKLKRYNIDLITISPGDDLLLKLILYFKQKSIIGVRNVV